MALQLILDSLEGLSEETKALYTTASTGKFHLDVEGGAVSKLKHDEFRNSNINLKKEVEGLKVTAEKYKDVDMEKYDEAVAKLREIEEKKLIEEGDIEGIVTQRTDLMAKEHTKQVTKMTDSLDVKDTEIGNLQSTLALSMIKSDIITEINGVAIIAEGALPDVLARCEQDWRIYKMESGKYDVEPIDGEGQIRYGEMADSGYPVRNTRQNCLRRHLICLSRPRVVVLKVAGGQIVPIVETSLLVLSKGIQKLHR